MFNQSVVYEQPVNELIRVCLRLEHLLMMAHQSLIGEHISDNRNAVSALIDILSLTDRPDLRSKLTKELLRQNSVLQRYLKNENIDQTKLSAVLEEVNTCLKLLQGRTGKFGGQLRENEFLNGIRQHLTVAGSTLSFDTPAFYYWLQSPYKDKHAQIVQWLNEMDDLFHIIHFIVKLVRQSGQPELHTAHAGFFQISLDPQAPCLLIRAAIPVTLSVFPEISVGRHGVGIRFYRPTVKERAQVCENDISFYLSCCIL